MPWACRGSGSVPFPGLQRRAPDLDSRLLKAGEKNATQLLENMDVSQSTLSHHMKILCDSGIVESRREGKWVYYSLSGYGWAAAARQLAELTCLR